MPAKHYGTGPYIPKVFPHCSCNRCAQYAILFDVILHLQGNIVILKVRYKALPEGN